MQALDRIKGCFSMKRFAPVKKAIEIIFLNKPIKCEVHPADFILLQ